MKNAARIILFAIVIFCITAAGSAQQEKIEKLDAYFSKSFKDFNAPGLAVAIVKDGNVIFAKGYGYRDYDAKLPVTEKSLFNIASCSKAFTGAVVALAEQNGKLKLTDKVIDHLPQFRMPDPYVTFNMNLTDLMTHRSGFGTFYGDLLWYETGYSKDDIISRIRYLPVTKDFRLQFGYQNNMFMIAGEVLEQATGKSWSDHVYEEIFKPLGMDNSRTCSKHLEDTQEIAYPHLKLKKTELYMTDPGPAFSIYSSVADLSRWVMMLLNGGTYQETQVMKSSTADKLFTPRMLLPVSPMMKGSKTHFRAYGLGWFLYDYFGRLVAEHSGGMPGYISKVALVPEENLGMVILTNGMNSLPTALMYKILDSYLSDREIDWAAQFLMYKKMSDENDKKQKENRNGKRVSGTKPSVPLENYAGTYTDTMYGDATIVLDGEQLTVTLLPAAEKFTSVMEHWHFDTFRIKFMDEFLPEGFVTFSFDTDRNVTGFTIDLPNPDFHFFNLDFKKKK